MIPHERSLVEQYKDKPFVLLGVNTDDDRDAYKKQAKEFGVNWRNFWDGDPSGPISTRWNVMGFPTVYLIDHRGVVRYREISGEQAIDAAVAELVAKAIADK